MTLGEKILTLRKARGWSQEELAGHIGVTRQALSRWESDTAVPDTVNVVELSDLFGVSCDYLLRDGWTEDRSAVPQKKETAEIRLAGWIITGLGAIGTLVTFILGFVLYPQGSYPTIARWWFMWSSRELLWIPFLCWALLLLGIGMVRGWDLAELVDAVQKEASPKKIRQDLGLDEEDGK